MENKSTIWQAAEKAPEAQEAPRAPSGVTCIVSKHRALTRWYVTAYAL